MKKKNNYFFIIMGSLFIIFVSYVIAYNSGYYELSNSRKAIVTDERIEEFEKDISKGENVDIKNYISNDSIDYSSKMSKVGNNISNVINNFIENGLGDLANVLGKLFI